MRVYFYPYGRFRDRQLAVIRAWPSEDVVNPELFDAAVAVQVPKKIALDRRQAVAWPQRIPLINVKRRPSGLPADVAVYVWGAIVATGPFIVDLDNPYALTGYNLQAMKLYRPLLRAVLASKRCVAVRCMSHACRESVATLFGDRVAAKAQVHYPSWALPEAVAPASVHPDECRFLFVSTQFEIKGGVALLKAFRRVLDSAPNARLSLITHLPEEFLPLVNACGGAAVIHEPRFGREEIFSRFISSADVLVHPTYLDSFGMIALEALAGGLGLVVTDVYALRELVEEGINGFVLDPPISIWDGHLPSRHYYRIGEIKQRIREADTAAFERALESAMLAFARDANFRQTARDASLALFRRKFCAQRIAS